MITEGLLEDLIFSLNPMNANGTLAFIFLKHVISCVIKISVGQVQLRGLHGTSMGCFKITAVIFRENNSILH
jgi:uncharacterized protein YejL (UPF0352 family)